MSWCKILGGEKSRKRRQELRERNEKRRRLGLEEQKTREELEQLSLQEKKRVAKMEILQQKLGNIETATESSKALKYIEAFRELQCLKAHEVERATQLIHEYGELFCLFDDIYAAFWLFLTSHSFTYLFSAV